MTSSETVGVAFCLACLVAGLGLWPLSPLVVHAGYQDHPSPWVCAEELVQNLTQSGDIAAQVADELVAALYITPFGTLVAGYEDEATYWSLALSSIQEGAPQEALRRAAEKTARRGLVSRSLMQDVAPPPLPAPIVWDFWYYLLAHHTHYRMEGIPKLTYLEGSSWIGVVTHARAHQVQYHLTLREPDEGFWRYLLAKGLYLLEDQMVSQALMRFQTILTNATEYAILARARLWASVAYRRQGKDALASIEVAALLGIADLHLYQALSPSEFLQFIEVLAAVHCVEEAANTAAWATMLFPDQPVFEKKLIQLGPPRPK